MPQTWVNTYSPQTPIGAGIQNIATAMFGGRSPKEKATDAAHADLYTSQAAHQRAAADLATQQAANERRTVEMRSPESRDQFVAYHTNVPLEHVQRYRNFVTTGQWGDSGPLPEPVARNIGMAHAIAHGMFADKTSNPEQGEKAFTEASRRGNYERTVAGDLTPNRLGAAEAARDGKPLYREAGGTVYSNFDAPGPGNMVTTPVGQSTRERNIAAALSSRAAAGEHGARTRQIDYETKTGVKVGAPVLVDDPEAGPIYTAASAAVGRAPAARPIDHAEKPGEELLSIKVPDPENAGQFQTVQMSRKEYDRTMGHLLVNNQRPQRPPNAPKGEATYAPSRAVYDRVDGVLDSLSEAGGAGGMASLNAQSRNLIRSRAVEYLTTPGSEGFKNPDLAAQLAFGEVTRGGKMKKEGGFMGFGGSYAPENLNQALRPLKQTQQTTAARPEATVAGSLFNKNQVPAAAAPTQPAVADPGMKRETDDAWAAINSGKDPAAVRQRFRQRTGTELPQSQI